MSYLSTTLRHYAKPGAISGACALFFVGVAWYAGNLSLESPVWRMVGVMPLLILYFTPYPEYDQIQARTQTADRRWKFLGHMLRLQIEHLPWHLAFAVLISWIFPFLTFWQYFAGLWALRTILDLVQHRG